jgi:PLP dependent protein
VSLARVQERIADACRRAGRDPGTVTLIAVTKGHGPDEIRRELLRHGHFALGENRVQEWQAKADALPEAEWHFIGNLQRNKVKYCLPFALIHSLNSERLANEMQRQGERLGHVFRVLVEVNVAGEASKQGVGPEAAARLVRHAQSLSNLDVRGLMTIAPYHDDPEAARPHFRALRALRNELGLTHLSMGMSGDFEVAVEEGATMVRVGSAIFSPAPADQTL